LPRARKITVNLRLFSGFFDPAEQGKKYDAKQPIYRIPFFIRTSLIKQVFIIKLWPI